MAEDTLDDTAIDKKFKELSSSPKGLSSEEADVKRKKFGPNVFEEKEESMLKKIFKYFWGPIPWMIEVAAILSLAIAHWVDFFFITGLLFFNAGIAFFEEFQAGSAIKALKKSLALKCRVLRDEKWGEIKAEDLVPGDVIRVRMGDIVPADALLVEGDYLSIDQAALTGESLPVTKKRGSVIYSSSIAKKGEMAAVVTATGKDSYFGKTIKLVAEAGVTSHFQKALMQIGKFLIHICLFLVTLLVIVQLFRHESFFLLLKYALILTIASIPVDMPAVLSVTMAVGALMLSKMKAIVTRLQSVEEMAGIDTLLSDKTGTLTQNKLTIDNPLAFSGKSVEEVISTAALASRQEDLDPIDLVILEAIKKQAPLEGYEQVQFTPFDPTSKRTEASIKGPQGSFQVTKGAPQVVLGLCKIDEESKTRAETAVAELATKGYRTLGVARKLEGKDWEFYGLIPLFDPPREDSKETIQKAHEYDIRVKMLTGDNLAIAKQIAGQLGIGENIFDFQQQDSHTNLSQAMETADGFAQVYPENKFEAVKALQKDGHFVGMTGDGVNDAPALKQADLGIAVSGATDAARAAASLVLTAPGLSVIIRAVEEARRIFERMNTYAIYRITETIQIMFFMILAIFIYNFYPMTALMIIMLAFLNDIPIMTIAYDRTPLSKKPVEWDMFRVTFTASVLGGVGVVETFLLLIFATSWLHITIGQLQTMIFLQLSVAGHLTLFVVRTQNNFFSRPAPSPILLSAIVFTQFIASLIATFGIFLTAIPWSYVGLVWAYCLVWMFIQDAVKKIVYHHLANLRPFLARKKKPQHADYPGNGS